MVPVAVAVPKAAPTGALKVAVKVSLPSAILSGVVVTGTMMDKVLAGMVTVVLTLVKSSAPAVPVVVVKVTVVGVALKPDSETVKLTGLPSVALAAAIEMVGTTSSSMIVPVAVAVPKLAPTGALKLAVKLSLPS